MSARDQQLQAFQEFQKNFFTSPNRFAQYTAFDCKRHGFVLMQNIAKGFPGLMNYVMNMKGFGWDAISSFEILRALQGRLVNSYSGYRMPNYLFYKTKKKEKELSTKTEKGLEFAPEVKREICQRMMLDSKTYEYLKFSEGVQRCGQQVIGNIRQSVEKPKASVEELKKTSTVKTTRKKANIKQSTNESITPTLKF